MHSQNRIVMKSLKSLLNPNVITQFRNNNRRYLKLQYFARRIRYFILAEHFDNKEFLFLL